MRRLEALVSLIQPCQSLVDIGSDHGYLAKMIADRGLAKKIHVTDVAKGPLSSAKKNLQDYEVDFHLMDGLKGFKEELDVAIVAGMGGELIARIIKDSKPIFDSLDYFLVQPMQQIPYLRNFLYNQGYFLEKELMVFEEKFYEVLLYKKGQDQVYDFRFSKGLFEDRALYRKYLEEKEKKLLYISKATKGRSLDKHQEVQEELLALRSHCRKQNIVL